MLLLKVQTSELSDIVFFHWRQGIFCSAFIFNIYIHMYEYSTPWCWKSYHSPEMWFQIIKIIPIIPLCSFKHIIFASDNLNIVVQKREKKQLVILFMAKQSCLPYFLCYKKATTFKPNIQNNVWKIVQIISMNTLITHDSIRFVVRYYSTHWSRSDQVN